MRSLQPSASRTTIFLARNPSSELLGYYHSSATRTEITAFCTNPVLVVQQRIMRVSQKPFARQVLSMRAVVKHLASSVVLLSCIFLLGVAVAAQVASPRPKSFDSYGAINSEDALARLDNFAVELQKRPDSVGYIVSHGPEGEGSGTGKHLLRISRDYLVNSRGIEPNQVETVYAGRYKNPVDVFTQLWIVPFGSIPPEPRRYSNKLKAVTGKFADGEGWDGEQDGLSGPYFGNVTVAALAERLRNQPNSVAYIVAFTHRDATPGTWRRVAKMAATDLQAHGIQTDRIKILFGGTTKPEGDDYPERAKLQYWILAANAPPPLKGGRRERAPKAAVQIGAYTQLKLKDPDNERLIFAGFADVLRADEQLRLCIIIRAELPTGESDLLPDEPPNVDQNKLVEKWKTELQEKFGVKEARIFILQAGAQENIPATVDVWIVPPGAALPDPHAVDNPSELQESSPGPLERLLGPRASRPLSRNATLAEW